MIAKIRSAIPYGFAGKIIEVEGDANKGLPAFNIVGMANKTVSEAKERVRSAINNSGFKFPNRKITISLAPAELVKDGTGLDLPIALSVMMLAGQVKPANVEGRMFVGELSLDGKLRPVRGVIGMVETAIEAGCSEIFVPEGNLGQARLVEGIEIRGIKNLKELYLALKGAQEPFCGTEPNDTAVRIKNVREGAKTANTAKLDQNADAGRVVKNTETGDILDNVRGQELAKRALTVAIAGHHNILLSGPPGVGKTMLAKVAANLLPEPTAQEKVEITKIYSLAGLATDEVVERRPFRSPHHSASAVSVLGGGSLAEPGEISLAHKGVLFLDEMPEFPRSVLEALRQPLEDRVIAVSRANRKTVYPADFMLIATMNPCPCGYLGDPQHECECTDAQIQNYQRKLSGPLFDRIDMFITVERVENEVLLEVKGGGVESDGMRGGRQGQKHGRRGWRGNGAMSEHEQARRKIVAARRRQAERFGAEGVFNSGLSSFRVSRDLQLGTEARKLLDEAAKQLDLSARAYFRTIKVAQTIADLEGEEKISEVHLAEALSYRRKEGFR